MKGALVGVHYSDKHCDSNPKGGGEVANKTILNRTLVQVETGGWLPQPNSLMCPQKHLGSRAIRSGIFPHEALIPRNLASPASCHNYVPVLDNRQASANETSPATLQLHPDKYVTCAQPH